MTSVMQIVKKNMLLQQSIPLYLKRINNNNLSKIMVRKLKCGGDHFYYQE